MVTQTDTTEEVSAERLLTPKEYAAKWGVHPRTVRRWERRGVVKAVRRGRVVRYVDDTPGAAARAESGQACGEADPPRVCGGGF